MEGKAQRASALTCRSAQAAMRGVAAASRLPSKTVKMSGIRLLTSERNVCMIRASD